MRFADTFILLGNAGKIGFPLCIGYEFLNHADSPGRIGHMYRGPLQVVRTDFDRCVQATGRGTADQQRNFKTLPFHFRSDVTHLVQARRNQA